jgi:hypothetical protein
VRRVSWLSGTYPWSPLAGLPRLESWFAVHGVDHLERDTRRLVEEEVGEKGSRQITSRKDESVTVLNFPRDERGEERLDRGTERTLEVYALRARCACGELTIKKFL